MNAPENGFVSNRVLRLNVGFLLSQSVGTSSDMQFDVPPMAVSEDLQLIYLRGTLHFVRTTEGILVQGSLNTAVEGECGRCLDAVELPIVLDVEELYANSENPNTEFIIGDDAFLDLTPLLHDEIIIATPLAPVCKPDCSGLCLTCGQNLNQGTCDCEADDIDPRLAVLLQLKNQD